MSTEVKNQTTLFRFVSLRSPQLSKKEDFSIRFLSNPNLENDPFYIAYLNKEENQSNFEVLSEEAVNFNAFRNLTEIKDENEEIFDLSDWFSSNKSKIDSRSLETKVGLINPISNTFENKLWSNVYYQIITQKDFYIKEAVFQVLIVNNILKNKEKIKSSFNDLINPLILLPSEVFDFSAKSNPFLTRTSNPDYFSGHIDNSVELQLAKVKIQQCNELIQPLNVIKRNYEVQCESEFNTKLNSYLKDVKQLQSEYEETYNEALSEKCQIPRENNFHPEDICNKPIVNHPKIQEFSLKIDESLKIDKVLLQLDDNQKKVLSEIVDISKIKTLDDLLIELESCIEINHQRLANSLKTSKPTMVLGDSVINLEQNIQVDSNYAFRLCSHLLPNGKISMFIAIHTSNASLVVSNFIYNLTYADNSNNTNGSFNQSNDGNVITLDNLFNSNLSSTNESPVISFDGQLQFNNGQYYSFEIQDFKLFTCINGKLTPKESDSNNSENEESNLNFTPNTYGYKQLGIADYRKVVSKICKYEVGEVAHIENIMAKELREKSTTRFLQTQIIETSSNEIETEKVLDTATTERFEMQTEVAKLMLEQNQFNSHINVNSQWNKTIIDSGASFASNTSLEESNRESVTQAKEITQRAVERVVSRVKNERTVKTTEEFTEVNTHIFDNTEGVSHVSGVYRYVNAIYKNQIYNYGKRLMYEFAVPQPSKLHLLGMEAGVLNSSHLVIEKPIDPKTIGITDFTKINKDNYHYLASQYNVEIETYPITSFKVGKSFVQNKNSVQSGFTHAETSSIEIPKGYYSTNVSLILNEVSTFGSSNGIGNGFHSVSCGTKTLTAFNNTSMFNVPIEKYTNSIPVSYTAIAKHTSSASVEVSVSLTQEFIDEWKKEAYKKIIAGYLDLLEAYNQKVEETKSNNRTQIESNPLFYRQIEQTILRHNCISYLMDHSNPNSTKRVGVKMYDDNATFTTYQVQLNKKMEEYTSFAKFMEQAFEWNLMSYSFYPYYWGNKEDWKDLYQNESNDALFRSFMQAGLARVIVTVKPGFEKAVMHYLATGQIWLGGSIPVIDNPLYTSIIDELKEQEYVIEESWNTTLPTSLIALQKSGVAVDAEGLPNLDQCEANTDVPFLGNETYLNKKTTT